MTIRHDSEIRSGPLRLVAATDALARADLEDRARFAALLGAAVGEDWPPELFDDDARRWMLAAARDWPPGWGTWFLVTDEADGGPAACGIGGYKGPPDADGTVEIGYSVLARFRGRGYATRAARALAARAFADPAVARVTAETLPELAASIAVLRRAGFAPAGGGAEPGTLRFVLSRAAFEGEG